MATAPHKPSILGSTLRPGPFKLALDILPQPDDAACGPTCLQAVYGFYGDVIPLEQVLAEVTVMPRRGTLAVLMGLHALERGYRATLFTYDLEVFDPSWFRSDVDLAEKLRAQAAVKTDPNLRWTTQAYLRFLELGGVLTFQELSPELIHNILRGGRPILTGLSATYLYGCAREIEVEDRLVYDDLHGESTGHFVVLHGYHTQTREVLIADPLRENPLVGDQHYAVGIHRLLGAIMLGVLTYDGNLLVLDPPVPAAGLSAGDAVGHVATRPATVDEDNKS
jgi:hypothetical protein